MYDPTDLLVDVSPGTVLRVSRLYRELSCPPYAVSSLSSTAGVPKTYLQAAACTVPCLPGYFPMTELRVHELRCWQWPIAAAVCTLRGATAVVSETRQRSAGGVDEVCG